MSSAGKGAPVSDRRRIGRTLIAAAAAVSACVASPASGASWEQLAAEHRRETCIRCRPPAKAADSIADLVRRIRQQGASPHAAPTVPIDVRAELRHVAAAEVDDQPRQAMRIADDLGPRDVRAAAAIAAAVPAGRVQAAAMLAVISIWMRADRLAALEWARGLPDEAARRAALDEVARRLVAADVRAARALAADLPAGPGRDDALCAVARQWARIDAAAARAWVESLAAGDQKTRMLEALSE